MNEFTIKIEAPGLAGAISRLADSLARWHGSAPAVAPQAAPPAPGSSAQTPPPVAPVATPAASAIPAPAAPAAVPTTPAPGYTLEQLSRAGADMVAADPGKMPGLLALLQQFGIQAVSMLPAEQCGAFATALRSLGAKI